MKSEDHGDRELDELTALLQEAPTPSPSDALKRRILNDHAEITGKQKQSDVGAFFLRRFFGNGWAPTGALAGLGALGFLAGMTSATSAAYTTEDEALYFASDTLNYVLVDGNEGALWGAD